MDADESRLNELSGTVIGCAFTVLNTLGPGFLEKVYEKALVHEVRKKGLAVAQQHRATVRYDGVVVGEYFADLLVEQVLLVELKTVKALDEAHSAQCVNYLKATGLQLCLLLNFGKPRLEIRRVANRLQSTPPHLRPSACICGFKYAGPRAIEPLTQRSKLAFALKQSPRSPQLHKPDDTRCANGGTQGKPQKSSLMRAPPPWRWRGEERLRARLAGQPPLPPGCGGKGGYSLVPNPAYQADAASRSLAWLRRARPTSSRPSTSRRRSAAGGAGSEAR